MRLAAETWESLFRAQVAVMRRLQAGPAFKGLAINEYDVLFTLSRCPSGWLRQNELNDHVLLSQSSLSRLVERLEKRGLVERMPAPDDGRGVLVRLTEAGLGTAEADRPGACPRHRRPGGSGAVGGRAAGAAAPHREAAGLRRRRGGRDHRGRDHEPGFLMHAKPTESPVRLAAETWESLFRAQVAVMRRLQAAPAFKALALNEYDVLFTLSRCPSGWLRLNELNDNVLLSQSSLSRLVERLEKRGLVERTPAPEDGRGVLIRLTDAGRDLQKQIGREHVRDIAALVGPALTAAEQQELLRLTEKLRASVAAH